ncbi:MAG TPA: GTP-sensing pleiotropic transcriptional regulator CodY [Bacillota bacterium]
MNRLEDIRKMKALLEKEGAASELEAAAQNMGEVLRSNLYMISNDGRVLSAYCGQGEDCTKGRHSSMLNPKFQQRLAFIFQPALNLPLETCLFDDGDCYPENTLFTIYPLQLNGERIGNLLLVRRNNPFSDDELVLTEVAAMIASVLMAGIGPESSSTEAQLKAHVKIALDSLSYSELEAISNVFSELGGEEGFLVASKVADRIGITRSVIVNAMRKLESAGVVESRSLGMKGTYIKVKNPYFLEQLVKRAK